MTDFETKEKTVEHPLEEVFDIEPGSTIVEYQEPAPMTLVKPDNYDDKDHEIENQLQEVFDSAMVQYETLRDETLNVEGKYKARTAEVSIQALNTALQSIRTKAEVKASKDKLVAKQTGGPQTLNQNLIVADRNELLKILDKED